MPVVGVEPARQVVGSFGGALISVRVGPLAQRSLDETFGLTVGTRAVGTAAAIAGDAMAHDIDARQLPNVEMQQGAEIGMLVAANRLDWFQTAELVESAARQNALQAKLLRISSEQKAVFQRSGQPTALPGARFKSRYAEGSGRRCSRRRSLRNGLLRRQSRLVEIPPSPATRRGGASEATVEGRYRLYRRRCLTSEEHPSSPGKSR
jgi:hypothetical protein